MRPPGACSRAGEEARGAVAERALVRSGLVGPALLGAGRGSGSPRGARARAGHRHRIRPDCRVLAPAAGSGRRHAAAAARGGRDDRPGVHARAAGGLRTRFAPPDARDWVGAGGPSRPSAAPVRSRRALRPAGVDSDLPHDVRGHRPGRARRRRPRPPTRAARFTQLGRRVPGQAEPRGPLHEAAAQRANADGRVVRPATPLPNPARAPDDGRADVRPAGILRLLPAADGEDPLGARDRGRGRRHDPNRKRDRPVAAHQPPAGVRRRESGRWDRQRNVPRHGVLGAEPVEADGVRVTGSDRCILAAPVGAGVRVDAVARQRLRRAHRTEPLLAPRTRPSRRSTTSGTARSARRIRRSPALTSCPATRAARSRR